MSCSFSVISHQVKRESQSPVSFKTIVQENEAFIGKTVILGGYILGTKVETIDLESVTTIEVLQTPLTFNDMPKLKEESEGIFKVSHKGLLDPDLYSNDRRITVAGVLRECAAGEKPDCTLESREIYVWPEYDNTYPTAYSTDPHYWHRYHERQIEMSKDKIYQNLPELE